MKPPIYIIERHEHGWLLRSNECRNGVPMPAMIEFLRLAGESLGKGAVMDAGISSALNAVTAVGLPAECDIWRKEIEASLAHLHPQLAWIRGTDTGISSKTIFQVLCESDFKPYQSFTPNIPHDADDFGRCLRLVNRMGWRDRLPEVSAAHPEWKPIIAEWDRLAAHYDAKEYGDVTDLLWEIIKRKVL